MSLRFAENKNNLIYVYTCHASSQRTCGWHVCAGHVKHAVLGVRYNRHVFKDPFGYHQRFFGYHNEDILKESNGVGVLYNKERKKKNSAIETEDGLRK